MKIQVVDLDYRGFHSKLSRVTRDSILAAGGEIGDSPDLTHFVRVSDLSKFLRTDCPTPVSFLMMGVANLNRFQVERDAFLRLVDNKQVRRIIVMSIHPATVERFLMDRFGGIPDKVYITDEPPYESPPFYAVQVDPHPPTCLYFGTYFYSKGADLLLLAALSLPSVVFRMVGDISITSFDYDIGANSPSNVEWRMDWVSEEGARDEFLSCDVVALPYRATYSYDTSGIFNQAMLAHKRVVAPDIPPFTDLFLDGCPIQLFSVEDVSSLALAINDVIWATDGPSVGRRARDYLSKQKGWDEIGKALMQEDGHA